LKSREVYECPAATVILEAHKDLEKMVMTRHEVLFKQQIDAQWVFLAYAGLWVDPLKDDLDAFINKSQENVTGEVNLNSTKGQHAGHRTKLAKLTLRQKLSQLQHQKPASTNPTAKASSSSGDSKPACTTP